MSASIRLWFTPVGNVDIRFAFVVSASAVSTTLATLSYKSFSSCGKSIELIRSESLLISLCSQSAMLLNNFASLAGVSALMLSSISHFWNPSAVPSATSLNILSSVSVSPSPCLAFSLAALYCSSVIPVPKFSTITARSSSANVASIKCPNSWVSVVRLAPLAKVKVALPTASKVVIPSVSTTLSLTLTLKDSASTNASSPMLEYHSSGFLPLLCAQASATLSTKAIEISTSVSVLARKSRRADLVTVPLLTVCASNSDLAARL